MQMNRRNVLVGLGTIVAGGGAALGSGAFSQAEATRTVDVNVVTGSDIADDLVDVLIKIDGHASLDLTEGGSSVTLDGKFPTAAVGSSPYSSYDQNSHSDGYGPTDVSLIENDVSIVVGTENNNLPANSTVSYDSLFAVVNDGTNGAYNVKFSSDTDTTFDFGSYNSATQVAEESSDEINVDVTPGDSSESGGNLTITITES